MPGVDPVPRCEHAHQGLLHQVLGGRVVAHAGGHDPAEHGDQVRDVEVATPLLEPLVSRGLLGHDDDPRGRAESRSPC